MTNLTFFVADAAGAQRELEAAGAVTRGQWRTAAGSWLQFLGEGNARTELSERPQRGGGVRIVADVRRPRVEMTGGRLLEQGFGRVEAEAVGRSRQQLGQRAAALMGRGGCPELLFHSNEHLGHLVLAVGRQVTGDQPPGVNELRFHEDRKRAAPVEDHGVQVRHSTALRFSARLTDTLIMRKPAAAAGLVVLALTLGACGGGGSSSGSSTPTTTPAPGAGIDPNSQGVIGGPANKAKSAVSSLNQQQQQEEQQTGG